MVKHFALPPIASCRKQKTARILRMVSPRPFRRSCSRPVLLWFVFNPSWSSSYFLFDPCLIYGCNDFNHMQSRNTRHPSTTRCFMSLGWERGSMTQIDFEGVWQHTDLHFCSTEGWCWLNQCYKKPLLVMPQDLVLYCLPTCMQNYYLRSWLALTDMADGGPEGE